MIPSRSLALVDVGAGAGLHLHLDRYRYRYNGTRRGGGQSLFGDGDLSRPSLLRLNRQRIHAPSGHLLARNSTATLCDLQEGV